MIEATEWYQFVRFQFIPPVARVKWVAHFTPAHTPLLLPLPLLDGWRRLQKREEGKVGGGGLDFSYKSDIPNWICQMLLFHLSFRVPTTGWDCRRRLESSQQNVEFQTHLPHTVW